MNQCERLLSRLEKGPINPIQAWAELGIYRLGARVFDLKQAGYNIKRNIVKVSNRFGEPCSVAQYRLSK